MRRLGLVDLAATDRELGHALREAIDRVARDGQFILGETVAAFEAALAARHGFAHALGVGSGSDALLLSLRARGVGPGDLVATTPLSFVATAEAIVRAGARPLFVDVDESLCMSATALHACLERHAVAAVVPVHLYGRLCDGRIEQLARDAGVPLIQDGAQAVGAQFERGGDGGAVCLSFFPSKNLGAWGDGGAILSDDADFIARVASLRVHGRDEAGRFREVGLNSRLDTLQAAVLQLKLSRLDDWSQRRRHNATRLRNALLGVAGIALPAALEARDVAHLFTVRVARRDRVMASLNAAGIDARVYYPRLLCDEPAFHGSWHDTVAVARDAAAEVLSLPIHEYLSHEDLDRIATSLVTAVADNAAPAVAAPVAD